MEIFILRHGHAEAEAACDKLRSLSPAGELEVKQAINNHAEGLASVERLIVSPYTRAQQTAKVVTSILGDKEQITSDYLVPNACPSDVIEYVYKLMTEVCLTSAMLVGHQPLLGILLDQLCGLEPGRHRLSTASIAAVDFEVFAASCCELRWVHHVSN